MLFAVVLQLPRVGIILEEIHFQEGIHGITDSEEHFKGIHGVTEADGIEEDHHCIQGIHGVTEGVNIILGIHITEIIYLVTVAEVLGVLITHINR